MSSQGAGSRSGVFPPWVVFGWRADAGTLRRISPVLERLVTLADRLECETKATATCEEAQVWPLCLACEVKDIRRELYSAVWQNDGETERTGNDARRGATDREHHQARVEE